MTDDDMLSLTPRAPEPLLSSSRQDQDDEEATTTTSSTAMNSRRQASNLRFVPTLLRKNWWLKKRHPIGLLLEILTPALFILVMSIIKHQTTEYNVVAGFSSDAHTDNLFIRGGNTLMARQIAPKYVVPETSMHGLLLHLGKTSFERAGDLSSLSPQQRAMCQQLVEFQGYTNVDPKSKFAVPEVCQGRVAPFKLAIAPNTTFTRQYFFETMKSWYPRVPLNLTGNATLVIPSFEDSVVFYKDEQALESYVKGKSYGKTIDQPRIFGAIVFDQAPEDDKIGAFESVQFKVRLNATFVGRAMLRMRYVPFTHGTKAAAWNSFQRELDTEYYTEYTSGGFMTLQTLVARFLNCMPVWDPATRSTTGKCQAGRSTAVNSTELDARLLQTLQDDPAILQVVGEMMTAGGTNTGMSMDAGMAMLASGAFKLPLSDAQKEVLLKPLRQAPQPYLGATTSPFPIETYSKSTFYDVVANVFPLFFMLTYLMTLSKVLVSLIAERETRARELMKILGVKESSIVLSWYITYIVILLISSLFQVAAAKVGIFENSNPIIIWLFFFLFSLSILGFAYMMSAVFSSARTGTYVGVIIFFIMYAVSNAFGDDSLEAKKNLASLLSPDALVFSVSVLSAVETNHIGIQFSNWGMPVNNYRLRTALVFFLVDAVLYTVIGLYLEKVVPKAYGTTEKWYFLFQPSYWRRRQRNNLRRMTSRPLENVSSEVAVAMNASFEPVSADLAMQEETGNALCVQGIRKVFPTPTGEKVAVRGVDLTMYSGQITCLLGHNGAGKTTLISMLTGVLPVTSGDAYFHGMSVREDMDELRESLGICFQHDVLYPELTVEEHLEFYARIKGYGADSFKEEVDKKIAEVGLTDKRSTLSNALSGGMKRKLSVAISLMGDSSLVFLDEPTSGMDPYSRRSTWEILMNNRQDRVMVLTTHFMDEADILGDRIAIMAEGEVRCCGSPLFLKNRYGAGYNLTIVKKEGCDDSKVIDFVLGNIPSGRLLSNVGTEIAFQLPLDASSHFAEMFRELDEQLVALELLSYGVSVTTMEEVFIKVAEAADEDAQQLTLQNAVRRHSEALDASSAASTTNPVVAPKRGYNAVFMTQFWALFQKRFRIAKRDKRFLIVSLFLPIAWMILGLSLLKQAMNQEPDKKLDLDISALAKEVPGHNVLLPSFCMKSVGSTCSQILSSEFIKDVSPVEMEQSAVGNPPFATDTPNVFGVDYTNPAINKSDTSGYLLKLSEVLYDRGYAQRVQGQFGGYLVHSDDQTHVLSYDVVVNTSLPHGSVIFKRYMDQSIYRLMAQQVSPNISNKPVEIGVSHHPLPRPATTKALILSYIAFTACLFFAIAFGFYPASIVALLVKERHPDHNSKHQQLVSGVGLAPFWLANYCWDVLVYFIPGGAGLILIKAFDMPALTGSNECVGCTSATFPTVIILFLLFGFAICPFAYCWTFVFREHASAQTKMILLNFVFGLFLLILSFVLDAIDSTRNLNKALVWVYRISPLYNLSNGLLNLTILEIVNNGGGEWSSAHAKGPMALENAGYNMIFLIVNAVLYFCIAFGADYALTFPKVRSALSKDPDLPITHDKEDEDVAAEAERVMTADDSSDVIQLKDLRKVYRRGAKVGVKDLTFGLKRGECFGFLGINGAGKTTTMKMLTGDIVPTAGGATLCGFDILTQQIEVRRQIGYCPQFDALIDLLSVREHLELFAKIKGVPKSELNVVVRDKIEQLGLVGFEDKLAGTLSGGNKRKLSVAMAMIGSPSILFLDEPSTGMDPVSRRFMWDVISEISTYNKSSTVVLTTHSMEECEALCSRVGIMVGGSLKCLGSIQHLKNRFSDGLMFDVKLVSPTRDEIQAFVLKHFDGLETQITRRQISESCARCGEMAWEQRIAPSHPTGFVLEFSLKRDDYVTATAFAAWWLTEVRFEHLLSFLHENFASVELLERQHDSCSFKLRDEPFNKEGEHSSTLKLSHVFECLESSKLSLAIREYSVSQTTLEQIFNTFASQQHVDESMMMTPSNLDTSVQFRF